jgi:copper chaperone CopZ
MKDLELKIDGMSCAHCVESVRKALDEIDGVDVDRVEVGTARLAYDPERTQPERILAAVSDGGFSPRIRND